MPRLKVYATRIGFHDAVVAAPNQKAALAAWDVRENLFAQGAASVATDPQAVKAANAAPGEVLRRAAGSKAPFAKAPAPPEAPKVPNAGRPRAKAAAAKAPPPRKLGHSPLESAERALAAFEKDAARRRKALERDLERERGVLARERDRFSRV
ncbi:MAG TPA: hypothetical protein VL460_11470 [Caulobacteraceae bacterium]|jgi:hypothetical protein|nr:hypothetical protein [Caulobacteraceae bacterium]